MGVKVGVSDGVVDGEEVGRWEEHTSERQSRLQLVCRIMLEKKNADSSGNKECTVEIERLEE